MVLFPFKSKRIQKNISLVVVVTGFLLLTLSVSGRFRIENIKYGLGSFYLGFILGVLGGVYFIDSLVRDKKI